MAVKTKRNGRVPVAQRRLEEAQAANAVLSNQVAALVADKQNLMSQEKEWRDGLLRLTKALFPNGAMDEHRIAIVTPARIIDDLWFRASHLNGCLDDMKRESDEQAKKIEHLEGLMLRAMRGED